MTSTAAVAHGLRSPFVVEEVELPDLQDTDVLVRIAGVDMAPDSDGTCEQCASGEPMYWEHFLELNFQVDKIVRFYPFNEINRAVEDQRSGTAIKSILEMAAGLSGHSSGRTKRDGDSR